MGGLILQALKLLNYFLDPLTKMVLPSTSSYSNNNNNGGSSSSVSSSSSISNNNNNGGSFSSSLTSVPELVDGTQELPTVILFKRKTLVFDMSQCFNKFGAKCFSEHDKCHIVVGQIRKICCKYGVNSVVLVGETFVPIMKIETMKVKQPERYANFGDSAVSSESRHYEQGYKLLWRMKMINKLFARVDKELKVRLFHTIGEADAGMASMPEYLVGEELVLIDNDSDAIVQLCIRSHDSLVMRTSTTPHTFYGRESLLNYFGMKSPRV